LKDRTIAISVILIAFLAVSALPFALAQSGPKTSDLQIHIYLDPDTCNNDLDIGILDMNDWPLAKEWIDQWALQPESIQLRDYVEMGMMEIDIYHQQWPTGYPTGWYTGSEQQNKSILFRKAIACLTDRDTIVKDVLKGYGYRLDVPLAPFQGEYADIEAYRAEGLIYDYNVTRAEELLDAAGFVDTEPDGIRNDPYTGNNMAPLKFYIRMDDPNRRRAGEMLTDALQSVGVPVNGIITEKTVCYKNVMVLYDYHIYTGGWSLSTVPDQYFDFYSSYTYWAPVGWSVNYPGYMDHDYDALATEVKYPATVDDAKAAAIACGRKFLEACVVVPLYSSAAVKAYKTGWTGVINNGGFGIDNVFTFLNMYKGDDSVIDWGFKSHLEQLNMISSEWLWDHNALGLIYDSLLSSNPWSLAPIAEGMAESFTITPWDATGYGGDADASNVTFNLRTNLKWHNDSAPVTVDDVWFSFNYTKWMGPGIAWSYISLEAMVEQELRILNSTAVSVPFLYKNAWAAQTAGGIPIVRQSIWQNVTQAECRNYDPAVDDENANGVVDIYEDGCGPFEFVEWVAYNYLTLKADTDFYLTQTYVENLLKDLFHYGAGDVDENGVVAIRDLGYMQRALGTTSGDPAGDDWEQYNSNCDLDSDGDVDALDLAVSTTNYGKTKG